MSRDKIIVKSTRLISPTRGYSFTHVKSKKKRDMPQVLWPSFVVAHKSITDIFGGQRIKALFDNGVT